MSIGVDPFDSRTLSLKCNCGFGPFSVRVETSSECLKLIEMAFTWRCPSCKLPWGTPLNRLEPAANDNETSS